MPPLRFELRLTAAVVSLFAVACPIDDRELHEASPTVIVGGAAGDPGEASDNAGKSGDSDGASNGSGGLANKGSGGETNTVGSTGSDDDDSSGGSRSQSASGGASGGSEGEGGTGAAGTPDCPDLDRNEVPDCEETLVDNAAFEGDVDGWSKEENVQASWQDADGRDYDGSGSMLIANLNFDQGRTDLVMRGVSQCVPAEPSTTYVFVAQARVDVQESQGWGGFSTLFYDEPNCEGTSHPVTAVMVGTTHDWSRVETAATSPSNAQSMLVRLVVNKTFDTRRFEVHFDNVLVRSD